MEENNKVLVLDNEELVLETIEMFYPSDDVNFICCDTLEKALSSIQEEQPPVIITNYILKEDSGGSLFDKINEKANGAEIIFLADINDFKDVLADFGEVVSDIVYKPLDMDVLETIIKRAQTRFLNRQKMDQIQQYKEVSEEETNRLNTQIIELNSNLQNHEEENKQLKQQLKDQENLVLNASESGSEAKEKTAKLVKDLEKDIEREKKGNSKKNEFMMSIISAIRRSYPKNTLPEIFSLFEETLKKQLNITQIQTTPINSSNEKKIAQIDELIKNNKLFLEYQNSTEIPFKISSSYYSFYIPEKIDLSSYTSLIYLMKDILTVIALNLVTKNNYGRQIEKERQNSKGVCSILANIQMYLKQSQATEKINATKDELSETANGIMDLIFNAQDEINSLDAPLKEKLKNAENALNTIVNDKSQNFDLISQKLSQVIEMVNNIKSGLEGQRMQKVSGDQYLFSKDRKLK